MLGQQHNSGFVFAPYIQYIVVLSTVFADKTEMCMDLATF